MKTIKNTLSRIDVQTFSDRMKELAISKTDRVHCPHPSCSAWIPPTVTTGQITCPRCKLGVCRACKGAAHKTMGDCPGDLGLQTTLGGGRQSLRQCIRCGIMVERAMGCNQIIW